MNRREQLLAGTVGALLVMMVGYYIWSNASDAINRRRSSIINLKRQVDQQDRTLRKATRATRSLAQLNQRSLPKDREKADSLYQRWLLDLVDRIGFNDPSVSVSGRRTRNSYFTSLRFDVDAQASLPQLLDFFGEFYGSDDLHRIEQLSIKPVKDTRMLDVVITIEALSLPETNRVTVGDLQNADYGEQEIADNQSQILRRSMFFPENISPRFASVNNREVIQDASVRIDLRAFDSDPWDDLIFEPLSELPEGAQLNVNDRGEAELRWTPKEIGEYDFEFAVHDTGYPARSDTTTFRITVVEPPPPEESDEPTGRRVLGFDDASQTFLVGTVQTGDQSQAWFSIRTRGTMLKLGIGQSVDVGSFLGDLAKITETSVEIQTEEGLKRVRIGQVLTDARVVQPPVVQPTDTQPTDAQPSEVQPADDTLSTALNGE